MVLPVTANSMRQQERRLDRINARSRGTVSNEALKESARMEVHRSLEHVTRRSITSAVLPRDFRTASIDSLSESSVFSTERAIERGSQRGLLEGNDHAAPAPDSPLSEMAPIAEHDDDDDYQHTDSASTPLGRGKSVKMKKKRRLRLFKRRKKHNGRKESMGFSDSPQNNHQKTQQPRGFLRKRTKSREIGNLFAEQSPLFRAKNISRDAWMCGCCGKMFASYEAAEAHENKCMSEAIGRLGFDDTTASSAIEPPTHTASIREDDADGGAGGEGGGGLTHDGDEEGDGDSDTEQLLRDLDLLHQDDAVILDTLPLGGRNRRGDDETKEEEVASPAMSPTRKSELKSRISDVTRQLPLVPIEEVRGEGVLTPRIGLRPGPVERQRRSLSQLSDDADDILVAHHLKHFITVTDEALAKVVNHAASRILTPQEQDAERELRQLARDKQYYDCMTERASTFKMNPLAKFRTDGKNFLSKVQNKFVDAYQLIKEGDTEEDKMDIYKKQDREGSSSGVLQMNSQTHYVNVIVRHSFNVVNNELERLAKKRWEEHRGNTESRFERFRAFAQGNLVKLASLALVSDFTPRKVSVQLSNDLYRLIGPQLKRRGVRIQTEIEYRVGPYFILAVNVESIDWIRLIKYTHRDVMKRARDWNDKRGETEDADNGETTNLCVRVFRNCVVQVSHLKLLTLTDVIARALAYLYYVHWAISVPICFVAYRLIIPSGMRRYILSTVTDDIFSYVEGKGMEMEIRVVQPQMQAAFMLQALRELREDSRVAKKKRQETESADKGTILGPLLGPAIPSDKNPAPEPPEGFVLPENLEFVGLEVDLPVGFKRLRWALLSKESKFVTDAIFAAEAKYDNIEIQEYSKHDDIVGVPELPEGLTSADIEGAEMESSYLMPASAFVKANTAFETSQVTVYNDYCFCIKKKASNPDVPYGSTFLAWTQYVITNTGNNTCHMVCSVEAEFPNGPPLIARQIQSGMRSGVAQLFVLIGETICKYADEYP